MCLGTPAHQPSPSAQALNRISPKTLENDRRKERYSLPLMTAEPQCSVSGFSTSLSHSSRPPRTEVFCQKKWGWMMNSSECIPGVSAWCSLPLCEHLRHCELENQ